MERSEGAEHFELEPLNPPDLETGREERGEEEREATRSAPAAAESEEEEGGGGAGDGVRCWIQFY